MQFDLTFVDVTLPDSLNLHALRLLLLEVQWSRLCRSVYCHQILLPSKIAYLGYQMSKLDLR